MLPKWHILLGLIFSILVYFIFHITLFQASLIFLASVLIDVDHYIWYVQRKKDYSLKNAYRWYKRLPLNHKPIMHLFHTIEFMVILIFISFFWRDSLFLLIGILLHSITDIIEFMYEGFLGRELSLIRYLFSDKERYLSV